MARKTPADDDYAGDASPAAPAGEPTLGDLAALMQQVLRSQVDQQDLNSQLLARLNAVEQARAGFAGDVHDEPDDHVEHVDHGPDPLFQQLGLLSALHFEPRPGFVQRWIRTHILGVEDTARQMTANARGWVPRQASTIPSERRHLVPKVTYGSQGDVIGIPGMILCERPIDLAERHRRVIERQANAQMMAVRQNLFQLKASGGVQTPQMRMSTSISKGRIPAPD